MTQPEHVLFIANSYVGIREEPKNSNNVIFNTRYYGRVVSGEQYAWCMAFVWDVFRIAGLSRLFYNGSKTASCSTLMLWARKGGTFVDKGFRQGDVILFDWTGKKRDDVAQHTGIFSHMANGQAVCIEGNTAVGNDSNGGQVMVRNRPLSQITGAHRPEWDEVVKEDDMTQTTFNKMADQYFRDRAAKQPSNWAEKDGNWEKAVRMQVFDGTAPQGIFTREQAAAVLGRLDLLKSIDLQPSQQSPAFVYGPDEESS